MTNENEIHQCSFIGKQQVCVAIGIIMDHVDWFEVARDGSHFTLKVTAANAELLKRVAILVTEATT